MARRFSLRASHYLALALGAAGAVALTHTAGCSSENATAPLPPPTTVPDIEPKAVSASFELEIDTDSPELDRESLDPIVAPLTLSGASGAFELRGYAKRIVHREGLMLVELYVENLAEHALRDVAVDVSGATVALADLTNDVFSEPGTLTRVTPGGIAPRGIGRVALGLARGAGKQKLSLTVSGVATARMAQISQTLAVAPDGSEVWAPFPDADVVAVVGAASNQRVASLPVPGHPSSVAITPDGAQVLVASAWTNTLTVVDRASRQVIQTLTEQDGIGREAQRVVVSPDGGRAFVSAYVGDVVTSLVRNGAKYRVERSIPVGRRPLGMSVAPDGKTVLVSHFLPRGKVVANEAWVSVIDVETQSVKREVTIDEPLNLATANCLADTFGVRPERVTSEGVATQIAGVFMTPGGDQTWATGSRLIPAPVFERGPRALDLSPNTNPRPGELSPGFIFYFDSRDAAATTKRYGRANLERAVDPSYLRCVKFGEDSEFTDTTFIPSAPKTLVNRFTANSSAVDGLSGTGQLRYVAFTRGARRALVLASNADQIVVQDVMTHHPAALEHLQTSGANPNGVVVSPDGRRAWVSYENSTFLSVLDLSAYAEPLPRESHVPYLYREVPDVPNTGAVTGAKQLVRDITAVDAVPPLQELARVELVDRDPMDPIMRRGKVLFSSSNPAKYPSLTKSRLGACASCHPGGGMDGTLWSTMEGERRTTNLRGGVGGRGWLHVSGTHRDIGEFAEIIVKERLGGDLSAEDRNAMAEYVLHGIPKLQSPPVNAALAAEGARVFEQACSSCHYGPQLSSGNPIAEAEYEAGDPQGPGLYDVGTATSDAHVIIGSFFESLLDPKDAEIFAGLRGDRALGEGDQMQVALDFRQRPDRKRGEFKAPSLVNTWDNVLFMHDGRFETLRETVEYLNTNQDLGLTPDQITAVVEYLKTL